MCISNVIGKSAPIARVYDLINRLSTSCSSVLLTGETGTGKEVIARAIHDQSPKRRGPFEPIDCAALADSLIESELFGHERGAYSGAVEATDGLFQNANGGTLFLDEVGEIPIRFQVKLLRVIQEREVRRVGSTKFSKVDVRLISATNRDLQGAARAGEFRPDLYYRIGVVEIEVPPLRARKTDIPMLVEHFLAKHSQPGDPGFDIGPRAWSRLIAHDWPGNVRELENCVLRALALGLEPTPDVTEAYESIAAPPEPGKFHARRPPMLDPMVPCGQVVNTYRLRS